MLSSMRFAVALLFLTTLIFGQETENIRYAKHPLTDMPGPAEDVQTTYYFPESPDLKLPVGGVVTTLCHFANSGRNSYNISAIMGSLNANFDFRHHYQNYSYKPFGLVVNPGEEITLKYNFQLHPELEPIDYQLAVTVFYDSETESFSNTFFNQTVELYLPVSDYDYETTLSVLFSLVVTVLVLVGTFFACFPESKLVQNFTNNLRSAAVDKENDDVQAVAQGKRKTRKVKNNSADSE